MWANKMCIKINCKETIVAMIFKDRGIVSEIKSVLL